MITILSSFLSSLGAGCSTELDCAREYGARKSSAHNNQRLACIEAPEPESQQGPESCLKSTDYSGCVKYPAAGRCGNQYSRYMRE
jgi:hypothetical protein